MNDMIEMIIMLRNDSSRSLWWCFCVCVPLCVVLLNSAIVSSFRESYMVVRVVSNSRISNGLENLKNDKYGFRIHSSRESSPLDPNTDECDSIADGEDLSYRSVEPHIPQQQRLPRIRDRVKYLARKMVTVPINVASSISPMPQAVASVLKDATLGAVDMAVEEGKC
jgi:hypothetical protein